MANSILRRRSVEIARQVDSDAISGNCRTCDGDCESCGCHGPELGLRDDNGAYFDVEEDVENVGPYERRRVIVRDDP